MNTQGSSYQQHWGYWYHYWEHLFWALLSLVGMPQGAAHHSIAVNISMHFIIALWEKAEIPAASYLRSLFSAAPRGLWCCCEKLNLSH